MRGSLLEGPELINRIGESLLKTNYVPLSTSKADSKTSFFNTIADISKIYSKKHSNLESNDFGNMTLNSRSFSLYEPKNNLVNNLRNKAPLEDLEIERSTQIIRDYIKKNVLTRNESNLVFLLFKFKNILTSFKYV